MRPQTIGGPRALEARPQRPSRARGVSFGVAGQRMFRVIGRCKRRAADGPLTSGSFARTFISGTRATGGLALARRALRVPFLRGTPRVVSDESVVHQIRVASRAYAPRGAPQEGGPLVVALPICLRELLRAGRMSLAIGSPRWARHSHCRERLCGRGLSGPPELGRARVSQTDPLQQGR
jgi:hypothetical protein